MTSLPVPSSRSVPFQSFAWLSQPLVFVGYPYATSLPKKILKIHFKKVIQNKIC